MHEDKKLNMHISLIWLSFTLVGLVHSCNITDVDTKMFYDLSPLIADPLKGHQVVDDLGRVFRFNICGHLSPTPNDKFLESDKVNCYMNSAATTLGETDGYICGKDPISLSLKNNNATTNGEASELESYLLLSFMKGDFCDPEDKLLPRQVWLTLTCDRQKFLQKNPNDLGRPVFLGESRCIYQFIWKTWAACPSAAMGSEPTTPPSAGSSSGFLSAIWFLFKMLAVFVLLYFVIGFGYNAWVLKRTGPYRIPHYDRFKAFSRFGSPSSQYDGYSPILPQSEPGEKQVKTADLLDQLSDIEA